jgi:hypothetical protein
MKSTGWYRTDDDDQGRRVFSGQGLAGPFDVVVADITLALGGSAGVARSAAVLWPTLPVIGWVAPCPLLTVGSAESTVPDAAIVVALADVRPKLLKELILAGMVEGTEPAPRYDEGEVLVPEDEEGPDDEPEDVERSESSEARDNDDGAEDGDVEGDGDAEEDADVEANVEGDADDDRDTEADVEEDEEAEDDPDGDAQNDTDATAPGNAATVAAAREEYKRLSDLLRTGEGDDVGAVRDLMDKRHLALREEGRGRGPGERSSTRGGRLERPGNRQGLLPGRAPGGSWGVGELGGTVARRTPPPGGRQ